MIESMKIADGTIVKVGDTVWLNTFNAIIDGDGPVKVKGFGEHAIYTTRGHQCGTHALCSTREAAIADQLKYRREAAKWEEEKIAVLNRVIEKYKEESRLILAASDLSQARKLKKGRAK